MAGFKVGSIFDGTLLSPIMDGVEFGSTRHSWLKPGLEQMVLPGALWWNAIFSTAPLSVPLLHEPTLYPA